MAERVYNFSAGPAVLPEPVLERARDELLNWHASGMSVMEMSHRGREFISIFDETKAKLKSALAVPESHEVLFMQGGGTAQFAAVPMNLMGEGGSADYAVTGSFSKKAAKEAEKYGRVNIAASGEDSGFTRVPEQSELRLSESASYFHYCANNTIYGTAWDYIPETGRVPLVADMSSEILSHPVDISKYGLIYAGAQKNMAPAGLTVVIMDRSLAGRELPVTPQVMSYATMMKSDSMPNTPPTWSIYMLGLVLDWLRDEGGVSEMARLRRERSKLLYELLDESRLFTARAEKGSRSDMNVTFRTGSEALDAEFIKGAEQRGLLQLKGHRESGGMRASLYNAMPLEGVRALVNYMKEFEVRHHV